MNVDRSSFEHGVAYAAPGKYHGWPSLAVLPSGEVLMVVSECLEHSDPYGKIVLVRSIDGGRTWDEGRTIVNTELDDRDPGIVHLRDGTILVTWYRDDGFMSDEWIQRIWGGVNHYPEAREWITPEIRATKGGYLTRSTDGGRTWEEPYIRTGGHSPHGPCELADGRLMYVMTRRGKDGKRRTVCLESADKGLSWKALGRIRESRLPVCHFMGEPHAIQLRSGKMLCLFRYNGSGPGWSDWHPPGREDDTYERLKYDYMWQSESFDEGRAWTQRHPTGMACHPPHLIQLRSGAVLNTYSWRRPPFGQRACVSYDEGHTWDVAHEIVIRDDAPDADLGYPASVELPDGTILTVHYQVAEPGQKPVALWSRFRFSTA